ncbi:MAG TPA: FprA family A-type flavoprotein [bacterium]|nr:FprA family A-type flavoprotein [bacterium]HPN45364.1 FprA family A-type flavoprotein [bacterium]
MKPLPINESVYWIGALHPELRVFDIIMETPYGSTYNSYLIRDEKIAVIDTVKAKFTGQYMDNLETLVNPADIDYIIVQHNEPDHSGSLAALLDVAKHAQVFCAKPAMKYVTNILNREVNMTGVGANDTLSLGKNKLTFIPAPFLHWPDTMMTWLENSKMLFTCDVFATHFADEAVFSHLVKYDFQPDFKYYFDMIMRPFKKQVRNALTKIEPLDIKIIAPSHGPVLTAGIEKYIQAYREWSAPLPENSAPQVLIYYATAHGNTGVMAEKIAQGARAAGAVVETFDACEIDINDHLDRIEAADVLLFGSPTLNNAVAKPVWDVLNSLVTIDTKGKTAASFGSMGWSGEAVPMLDERLKAMKFKAPLAGIQAILVPGAEELQKCFAFGQEIVTSIKNL